MSEKRGWGGKQIWWLTLPPIKILCILLLEEFDKLKKSAGDVIEPDLKLMIATHDKLVKGEKVEQNDVSVLLLGGIINIIRQHDTIAPLEEKH